MSAQGPQQQHHFVEVQTDKGSGSSEEQKSSEKCNIIKCNCGYSMRLSFTGNSLYVCVVYGCIHEVARAYFVSQQQTV